MKIEKKYYNEYILTADKNEINTFKYQLYMLMEQNLLYKNTTIDKLLEKYSFEILFLTFNDLLNIIDLINIMNTTYNSVAFISNNNKLYNLIISVKEVNRFLCINKIKQKI